MKVITFFGIGTMGLPISLNLIKGGYEVRTVPHVTTDPKKLKVFEESGGIIYSSVAEAVRDTDFIFSIVTDDTAILSVLKNDEIINNINKEAVIVDMTSCSDKAIKEVSEAFEPIGVKVIDAPVSGGVPAAKAGTMIMMCAGEKGAFDKALPLLETIGENIKYVGEKVGNGKQMKSLNNLLGAMNKVAICEVFKIAEENNIDLDVFGDIISGSSGNSAQFKIMYPRLVNGNYTPNFTVALMRKDVGLALRLAEGMDLPAAQLTYDIFNKAKDYDNEDSAAIFKVY